jgi:hypothetical protein
LYGGKCPSLVFYLEGDFNRSSTLFVDGQKTFSNKYQQRFNECKEEEQRSGRQKLSYNFFSLICRNIKNNLMFADKREKNKELSSRWKEQNKEHRT